MGFACTGGESSATVSVGGDPEAQLDAENKIRKERGQPAATPGTSGAAYVVHEQGKDVKLTAPDLTDNLLEEARKRMGMQLLARSDRRRSLSGGTYGTSAYSLLEDPRASRLNKPFR